MRFFDRRHATNEYRGGLGPEGSRRGALLGLGVALLVLEFARSGGGITVSMGAGQGYFRMMPTLLPAVPFLVVGSACLGSVLAAVSPALRAARMRPVEALSSS